MTVSPTATDTPFHIGILRVQLHESPDEGLSSVGDEQVQPTKFNSGHFGPAACHPAGRHDGR